MLPGVVSIFASPGTFPEAGCHGLWHGGLSAGTKHAVEQSSPSDPRYDRRPATLKNQWMLKDFFWDLLWMLDDYWRCLMISVVSFVDFGPMVAGFLWILVGGGDCWKMRILGVSASQWWHQGAMCLWTSRSLARFSAAVGKPENGRQAL